MAVREAMSTRTLLGADAAAVGMPAQAEPAVTAEHTTPAARHARTVITTRLATIPAHVLLARV